RRTWRKRARGAEGEEPKDDTCHAFASIYLKPRRAAGILPITFQRPDARFPRGISLRCDNAGGYPVRCPAVPVRRTAECCGVRSRIEEVESQELIEGTIFD